MPVSPPTCFPDRARPPRKRHSRPFRPLPTAGCLDRSKRIIQRPITIVALLSFATASGAARAQDLAAGERSWNKCRACHQLGETARNGVGPQLNGLFGRTAGSVEGYSYSAANKGAGITWDEAVFADYIKDPRAKIPGTKMVFAGIRNEQEVKDLIAFLKQFGPDGKKL